MIRYDPTLVDLTSNFFVLCTDLKVYLYNYSKWVEYMNIHDGKHYGKWNFQSNPYQLRELVSNSRGARFFPLFFISDWHFCKQTETLISHYINGF